MRAPRRSRLGLWAQLEDGMLERCFRGIPEDGLHPDHRAHRPADGCRDTPEIGSQSIGIEGRRLLGPELGCTDRLLVAAEGQRRLTGFAQVADPVDLAEGRL